MAKISPTTKVIIVFFAIYFFLAWALTSTYFLTHVHEVTSGDWAKWHESLINGQGTDSNQFRLLSIWLAQAISKSFVQPIFTSYLIMRFFFTFLTLCLFHLFLLKWFGHQKAFLSTVILAAITPITFFPFMQESDMILLFFFLLALWLIRERRFPILAFVIFLGTFAKETIIFVIPLYFFLYWGKDKRWRLAGETLALLAVWGAAFYLTRHAFYLGHNSPLWQLPHNIMALKNYIFVNPFINFHIFYIPIFGVMWILPFMNLRQKPLFFRRAVPLII